jgi:hypothetical protein
MGVEVQTGHDPSGSSSYLTGIIQRVNSPRPGHLIFVDRMVDEEIDRLRGK